MKKIIVIPLDERPCNYEFPYLLGAMTPYEIVRPPSRFLGKKKRPGQPNKIWQWMEEEAKDADGIIISFDTLLYSGIVPSRLHSYTKEDLLKVLSKLRRLKEINEHMIIYGFSLIMRNPTYSSSDEEPDYYQDFGREIHLKGVYDHKTEIGIITKDETAQLEAINKKLPMNYYNDYLNRRAINLSMNKEIVSYVKQGLIDFLVIPQDDASLYGLTALDQQVMRSFIRKQGVTKDVYMYPGADEVANTLLARLMNTFEQKTPTIFVKYTSEQAKAVIPLYEDRPLYETIKYQIIAAGGIMATSMSEADILLLVNAPASNMLNASEAYKKGIEYNSFRSLTEGIRYADYVINTLNKPVIIADVAYGNGSDLECIELLQQHNILFKLAGYAGWNTSSNTLGTCIPQGMIFHQFKSEKAHRNFLGLRYAEDAGYCAKVRQDVIREVLPSLDLDYFHADGKRGEVANQVKQRIEDFLDQYINTKKHRVVITDCYMPWERMFEVGLQVITDEQ